MCKLIEKLLKPKNKKKFAFLIKKKEGKWDSFYFFWWWLSLKLVFLRQNVIIRDKIFTVERERCVVGLCWSCTKYLLSFSLTQIPSKKKDLDACLWDSLAVRVDIANRELIVSMGDTAPTLWDSNWVLTLICYSPSFSSFYWGTREENKIEFFCQNLFKLTWFFQISSESSPSVYSPLHHWTNSSKNKGQDCWES